MGQRIRCIFGCILRFLLPWACAGCRTALTSVEDQGFCGRCWLVIPRIRDLFCKGCGLPLPDGGSSCYNCRLKPLSIVIRAATQYRRPMPSAIHRFKYFGRKSLAGPFSRLLQAAYLQYAELQPVDALVPVPLHDSNRWMRGFNQADVLALNLAKLVQIPNFSGLIVRNRRTRAQYRLGKSERRDNVRGAFSASNKSMARGMHLLLIDDICTTGSTLHECALVLRRAGAASVKALVLARD